MEMMKSIYIEFNLYFYFIFSHDIEKWIMHYLCLWKEIWVYNVWWKICIRTMNEPDMSKHVHKMKSLFLPQKRKKKKTLNNFDWKLGDSWMSEPKSQHIISTLSTFVATNIDNSHTFVNLPKITPFSSFFHVL